MYFLLKTETTPTETTPTETTPTETTPTETFVSSMNISYKEKNLLPVKEVLTLTPVL